MRGSTCFLIAKERRDVAVSMEHVQYQYNVIPFDAMNDDVVAHGEASQTAAQIATSPTADIGALREQPEAFGDIFNHARGNLDAAAFAGDAKPDIVKLRFRVSGEPEFGHSYLALSAASLAMPRRFTSSASCVTCSRVVTLRPSPQAREASALQTQAKISNRRRSRSSQSDKASRTASSSSCSLPV